MATTRTVKFDSIVKSGSSPAYDTAAFGWTLAAWSLSPADPKTNFVGKPGGDGSWDLSTSLTDGVPRYNDRTLTAILELSTGTRDTRETAIRTLFGRVHGKRLEITPPDGDYRLFGRVQLRKDYNDHAHAAVTVTAICEPWLYYADQGSKTATASATTAATLTISNSGHKTLMPEITVADAGGEAASVTIQQDNTSQTLTAGTYVLPWLVFPPGRLSGFSYRGTGKITVRYRMAVLE